MNSLSFIRYSINHLMIAFHPVWFLFRMLLITMLIIYGFAMKAQSGSTAVPDRPNIILIVADDLGYNDLACFGAPNILTPNLDCIASSGMRFTDFYVSQAVCSASRASILTGCYANRVGIMGALTPNARTGLNKEETTIAEILKKQGYHTAIIGKWHLGDRKEFLPLQHGFDSYFGIPYSNDMWPMHPDKLHFPPLPVYENNRVWTILEEQSQVTTWYTERAVEFIRGHHKKPFFLYLAHSMPHVPLYVSDKFSGKSTQGIYGDVVMEIDWSVGEILTALREEGLDENTLMIFTSDNGPWLSYGTHAGSAFPLREGKGTAWDGGQRVPTVMMWPAVIPEGAVCREPAMTIDLLPTIAEITGAPLPEKVIDGKSILPLIRGDSNANSPHEALFFYYGRKLNCIRSGEWKFHLPHGYRTLNGRKGRDDGIPISYDQAYTGWALYNVTSDPEEVVNLYDQYPEIVGRMKGYADSIILKLGDSKVQGTETRPPGYIRGFVAEKGQVRNMAIEATLAVDSVFTGYTLGGVAALHDGITGTMRFNDGAWLGLLGKDLDALICFPKDTLIRRVSVNFLVDRPSWIFEPEMVYLLIPGRETGSERISLNKEKGVLKQEPSIITYSAKINQEVKCFQVVGVNRGICPPGHPGEGKEAWIFVDEIVVR